MTCCETGFDTTSTCALGDAITKLAAHINAATWRLLSLIREYDLRSGWNDGGCRSCAHWLNWKCGINLGAAREKVRVAHALVDLPQISAAFREGRLSYSKVRAMTRVATKENEEYLLMIADHGTASHVERLISRYRRLGRLEAAEREEQRHQSRQLRWHIDESGCYIISGRLPPEQGARFVAALRRASDGLFREREREREGETLSSARVSAETPNAPPAVASTTLDNNPATNADALKRLVDDYLASPDAKSSGGDRYTLHIHCDAPTLQATGEGAEAEVEDGARVSAETSRRLACDCGVVPWLHKKLNHDQEIGEGEPLHIGRRSRSVPPALRRALTRRDGGCAFPGCTAVHHVDAHHIVHWADGGETKLGNLVLLCRRHHRLVHEGGYQVALTATHGGFRGHLAEFRTAAGDLIDPGSEKRFRGNAAELIDENDELGLNMTADLVKPRWRGERMDYSMAIDGLRTRDRP